MRKMATLLLAFSVSVATPAFAESTGSGASPLALSLYNFGQVSPTYFRGAEPDGAGVAALAKAGVKLIIDLQADGDKTERQRVESAGMRYVRIPMTTHVVPTDAQMKEFLGLVNDPANQPVYVHCKEGRHRTGVMTAVYRMNNDGWNADKAFSEMKNYKFGMDFLHSEFKKFVYRYKAAAPVVAAAVAGPRIETAAVAEPRIEAAATPETALPR